MKLSVEYWPVARLQPYARNPRKNDKAVDRMCASITEYGFTVPCLVRSDGEVVDGHLRLKAAAKLEILEVPVIICDQWTPAQVKGFRLMVNRSVAWAEWDLEALGAEFAELKALDFDLAASGFDGFETSYNPSSPHAPAGIPGWEGMPEFNNEHLGPEQSILVHFKSSMDREMFASLVKQSITEKTKYIWYTPDA